MASGRTRTTRVTAAAAMAALVTGGLAGCQGHSATARGSSATAPVASPQQAPQAPPAGTPTATPAPAATITGVHSAPPSPAPTTPARTTPPAAGRPRARGTLPPVISKIATKDKVVFITIDDGWHKDRDFIRLIRDRKIPVTLFLTNDAVKDDYGYFRRLQQAGAQIQDHTMTHPLMTELSYARQKHQICKAADIYASRYGTRPTLFRAPYGASNTTTRRAARDCGMQALLFWRETSENGDLAYQTSGGLHPGDIILVHFEPHMTRDFRTLLRRIDKQGYQPAELRDYLPARYFQPAR
ncbi:polysaccharide deacetylase family protein [Actinomadura scrupuli]|uniref:polysaccharide deacetylase family protein n=1 Tax=Actinomadura scrupuli TaxID=559629 RepID=UPI003D98AF0C